MRWTRLLAACLLVLSCARLALRVTNGLSAEYFTNTQRADTPAFTTVDAVVSTASLDEAWVGDPPPAFSARWQGYITLPAAGTYTFATRSDDGSRVTIGDRLVVDNSGNHSARTERGTVPLPAGPQRVLVEFEQEGGGYELALLWAPAGGELEPVPSSMLTTQRVPAWKLRAARALDGLIRAAVGAMLAWLLWTIGVRWQAAAGAIARRPRAAALAFFILLAIVETWPLARHPGRLSRNDNNDTILNEWVLAWVAHEAPRAPLALFDANIFNPERDTLAYSESMIVQSAMAAPLHWLGASPVLAYNLVLIAGLALTGWSLCIVMARWTGEWGAGLLSGVLAAFNAYTLTNLPHLQSLHVEFLPPALFALDATLREPRIGAAVRLAAWFALQALTSVYLLVFSAFALTIGALVRPEAWRGARFRRVAGCTLLAASLAGLALLPFLLPYWRVYHVQGFSRTIEWQAKLSAHWQDYLTTPGRAHYALWASGFFSSTGLFPGIVGAGLTAVAIASGVAWSNPRARMCLAFGVCGVVLSFGPAVPGYTALYHALPPLHAIRAVSRFGFLALFAIAALAGFGLAELRRRVPVWRGPLAAGAILLLAALEPFSAPLALVRAERISPIYARLAGEPGAVVAELPFYGGGAAHAHAAYMLNSTAHWRPTLNGYSGVEPESFARHVEALGGFPDAVSLAALQAAGVTHVFVHAAGFDASRLQAMAEAPALLQLAAMDGIVLYRLLR